LKAIFSMQAIAIEAMHSPVKILDVPGPQPGDGEILVRVRHSSLNGFDLSVAAGRLEGMMEYRFPAVLGSDYAGTVEAIGDGARRFAPGDAVFGVVMKPHLGSGSFAPYVAVSDQFGIEHLPPEFDPASGGALGLAGSAALAVVDAAGLRDGDTVLVVGATGGVGALVVQYAKHAGAHVIATRRPGEEAEFLRGLGAGQVVDYTGDLARQVRDVVPEGMTVVIHLAGDPTGPAGLLAPGGKVIWTLGYGSDQNAAAVAVRAYPDSPTLTRLADDASAGRLRVPIGRTYEFEEIPRAFEDFSGGTLGKLALMIA
jgi:NADPH:quinone reductase-like Zn-dependent oxidoreductase